MEQEHKLEIIAGWDKRSDDPKKNYGVHGVTMKWLSIAEKGAVQFVLYTNWMPSHLRYEKSGMEMVHRCVVEPLPADLGYHSPTPMYEDQTCINPDEPCPYLAGEKNSCYYDGSSLHAMDAFKVLTDGRGDKLWEFLDAYYEFVFCGGPYPGTQEWQNKAEATLQKMGFGETLKTIFPEPQS